MPRQNTMKPAIVQTDEDKVKSVTSAAAGRSRGKNKGQSAKYKYYAAWGVGVGTCVLGGFLAMSGPSAKKGGDTVLDAYVNDGSSIADITTRADGNFTAAASPFFNKWTFADIKWGHAGISLSNMVGMSGAVSMCEVDDSTEGGSIPPSYDAREQWPGCFGPAIDAGNCSSSYATAAADALAARYCIADNEKYNNLRLSAQQILSCDKKSRGCKGGGVDNVWAYIQRRGLYPESCLPYAGEKGAKCATECKEEQKMKVLEHCVLTQEKAIKREIYNRGPVVAPIFMKSEYFVYSSGVYTPTDNAARDFMYDDQGKTIMNAAVILGWGRSHGTPYWLVRHSWGTGWGEEGYSRIAMGTVVHENYVMVGVPATDAAIAAAAAKEEARQVRLAEAKKDRALRDERIAANRAKYEAEKAAEKETTDLKDLDDDDDFEAEVDLDSDVDIELNEDGAGGAPAPA